MRKAFYLFIALCCSTVVAMAGINNHNSNNSSSQNSNSNSNSSSSSVTITLSQTTFDLTFGSSFIEIQQYVTVSTGADIVVYYYQMDDDGNDIDDTETTVQPKTAGNYHVVVTVEGSDVTADAYFYIQKVTPVVTVDADGYTITYGDDPVDFESLVSNNADDADITIIYSDADGNTYTDQPTDAGQYTVTIVVEATENSEEVTVETTLTILKSDSNATFDIDEDGYTIEEGDEAIDFTELVDNPDNADITITYIDADGNEYDEQPTDAGEYTVVIVVEETDNTEAAQVETTLTITASDDNNNNSHEENNVETAIDSVETGYSIAVIGGQIVITADELTDVTIYDAVGRITTRTTVDGKATFSASKGINIVVLSNGKSQKVLVR